MAFFGTSSAGASTATTPVLDTSKSSQLRQEIQDQISQELAVANATELVNKITENCFQKCIAQPSSALSGPEEMCVNQCLEKYMRSWNVISKAYITRIQQSTNSQN